MDLLREWAEGATAAATAPAGSVPEPGPARCEQSPSRVFISYSHSDLDVVRGIQSALESAGIRVCIDARDIRAGEDIESFIRRMVAESDAVLSTVSRDSLLSPWVGMESVYVLYDEALKGGRKLIACYLDEEFLDLGFRIRATDQIDIRIGGIDALLPASAEKHIDTGDLNRQKSRLFELRYHLGKILDRLRGSLSLDVREPSWDENLPRIIGAIKENKK